MCGSSLGSPRRTDGWPVDGCARSPIVGPPPRKIGGGGHNGRITSQHAHWGVGGCASAHSVAVLSVVAIALRHRPPARRVAQCEGIPLFWSQQGALDMTKTERAGRLGGGGVLSKISAKAARSRATAQDCRFRRTNRSCHTLRGMRRRHMRRQCAGIARVVQQCAFEPGKSLPRDCFSY